MTSAPRAFRVGVIEKHSSICPKLAINAEHYDLVFSPRQKKSIPSNLGGQFATQKCSKLAPSFFGLDSYCKTGLIHLLY